MAKDSKVDLYCDRIIVFSFYALIFFLPISKALIEILSGTIILPFFVKRTVAFISRYRQEAKPIAGFSILKLFFKSFRFPAIYLNVALLLFLMANVLSVALSVDFALSIRGLFGKLLQGFLVFYALVDVLKTQKKLYPFLIFFLCSAVLININGLFQFFVGHEFIFGEQIVKGRVYSTFSHANDFGSYLLFVISLILALLAYFLFERKKGAESFLWHKYTRLLVSGLLFVAMLSFACLGLTLSRGVWVCLIVGLLLGCILNRKVFLISIPTMMIFLIIFIPKLQADRQVNLFTDTLKKTPSPVSTAVQEDSNTLAKSTSTVVQEDSNTLTKPTGTVVHEDSKKKILEQVVHEFSTFGGQGRSGYWQEAINVTRDFPVFGAGLNTYSKVAPLYKVNWGGYAHNCYLQMAAETGLIGLVMFLFLIGFVFVHSIRSFFCIPVLFDRMLFFGVFSGIISFLFHCFLDTDWYSSQLNLLFWIMLAILVSIEKIHGPAKK